MDNAKKQAYEALNYNGFKWVGFIDGLHHFSKKEDKGYLQMTCTEEMLNNGDAYFMALNGLTYNPK